MNLPNLIQQIMSSRQRFDVVAVSIETNQVRILAEDKDKPNADSIMEYAVIRRGTQEEFFSVVPAGTYKGGDDWKGANG